MQVLLFLVWGISCCKVSSSLIICLETKYIYLVHQNCKIKVARSLLLLFFIIERHFVTQTLDLLLLFFIIERHFLTYFFTFVDWCGAWMKLTGAYIEFILLQFKDDDVEHGWSLFLIRALGAYMEFISYWSSSKFF